MNQRPLTITAVMALATLAATTAAAQIPYPTPDPWSPCVGVSCPDPTPGPLPCWLDPNCPDPTPGPLPGCPVWWPNCPDPTL